MCRFDSCYISVMHVSYLRRIRMCILTDDDQKVETDNYLIPRNHETIQNWRGKSTR